MTSAQWLCEIVGKVKFPYLLFLILPGFVFADGPMFPSPAEILRNLPSELMKAAKLRRKEKLWEPFKNGDLKAATQVINSDFDLNQKDHGGKTPLCYAAEFGYTDIVLLLIKSKKIQIDVACAFNSTALLLATDKSHLEVIKILVGYGAKVDTVNANNETVFHLAKNDIAILDFFVSKQKLRTTINIRDKNGKTPLQWAVLSANLVTVSALLKGGADPNTSDTMSSDKAYPLHMAVDFEKVDVVQILLQFGAHVDVKNAYGETPLDIAAKKKNNKLIQILKKR